MIVTANSSEQRQNQQLPVITDWKVLAAERSAGREDHPLLALSCKSRTGIGLVREPEGTIMNTTTTETLSAEEIRDGLEGARQEVKAKRQALEAIIEDDAERILVHMEGSSDRSVLLQIVDTWGPLSELDKLRRELAIKAVRLGGNLVCDVVSAPFGEDRVLVSGMAVNCDRRGTSTSKSLPLDYQGTVRQLDRMTMILTDCLMGISDFESFGAELIEMCNEIDERCDYLIPHYLDPSKALEN